MDDREWLFPLDEDVIARILVLVGHETCGLRVSGRLVEQARQVQASGNGRVEFVVEDPELSAGEWKLDLAHEF
jgi:hypothetical protein